MNNLLKDIPLGNTYCYILNKIGPIIGTTETIEIAPGFDIGFNPYSKNNLYITYRESDTEIEIVFYWKTSLVTTFYLYEPTVDNTKPYKHYNKMYNIFQALVKHFDIKL